MVSDIRFYHGQMPHSGVLGVHYNDPEIAYVGLEYERAKRTLRLANNPDTARAFTKKELKIAKRIVNTVEKHLPQIIGHETLHSTFARIGEHDAFYNIDDRRLFGLAHQIGKSGLPSEKFMQRSVENPRAYKKIKDEIKSRLASKYLEDLSPEQRKKFIEARRFYMRVKR